MGTTLVLTIMGADRPGLVAEMAGCIADHEGNWIESRLVHLGGQFAGVLRVGVPDGNAGDLEEALRNLEDRGLRLLSKPEAGEVRPEPRSRLVRMELIGSDRPGILNAMSAALARHAVNIEELSTELRTAPMSGELLFHARAVVYIPEGAALAPLRADLEKIAADLMVDLLFAEATTA